VSIQSFIDNLDTTSYNPFDDELHDHVHDPKLDTERPPTVEIVMDAKTGQPRQAGAAQADGAYIYDMRKRLEHSLFSFAKGVLARHYLSPVLHLDVSKWAMAIPPYRKLLLLPREHAKTSIISHALPIHIAIQPADDNAYFPGRAGVDIRILLCGETEKRATNNLSVIEQAFEGNRILRGLWPHVTWDNPRKQADRWNARELVLPRNIDYPDPNVMAIGVGGAITGGRFDVQIKDDLVTLEAANSQVVMDAAIRWHLASRALRESDSSLEYIIGTRWAAHDLYHFIEHGGVIDGEKFEPDHTVDIVRRAIVENGRVIYPEKFSIQPQSGKISVVDLQREHGTLFTLMYMNSATDPSLVDFNMNDVRSFTFSGATLTFTENEMDAALIEKLKVRPVAERPSGVGLPLNSTTYDVFKARHEHLRRVKVG
jgi:hypothetical protein